MSFLAPLYLLGAIALIGPIIFHLISRTPKGEVPFSSLMFLEPTPPRMTRRSRLDNWPLLLLRLLALLLLALGFGRPFLRQAASLAFGDEERRRVAILIDTSASLRRADLWDRAVAQARAAILEARAGDQLALIAFDSTTRTALGFDEGATLGPDRRRAVALDRLGRLAPTWAATDLGRGLVDAVAALEDVGDRSEKAGRMPRRVVLVTDLQGGANLDALGDFEWPSDVDLALRVVASAGSNATPERLGDPLDPASTSTPADASTIRVRVANDERSKRESFRLSWVDAKGLVLGTPTPAYVPPGESRVVRVPRSPQGSTALRLVGDDDGFDDTLYFAPAGPKDEAIVVYLGLDAPDDPAGLLFYLLRVFEATPGRTVRVVARKPADPPAAAEAKPALVVVGPAGPLPGASLEALSRQVREGASALVVVGPGDGGAANLAALAGAGPIAVAESAAGRDALIGQVSFDHPLFAPLAGPQFSDFTKIRFWKHRRLAPDALPGVRVLARFDDGDAAVLELPIGKGRVVALTSGWNPADSQLARSSKFVPLMASLLEGPGARPVDAGEHRVGVRVALPPAPGQPGPRTVRKPDGTTVAVGSAETSFAATDQPGVYTIEGATPGSFAVNLDPSEGKVAPLAAERLEQLGIRLAAGGEPGRVDRERIRQMQNAELEGRQKLWRWLVLAAIVTLIVETWLAARPGRGPVGTDRAEVLAT